MLCVIVCLSFTFSLLCGVGNALEENEIIVSVVLTSQTGYPGSGAVASVFLVNNSTEILTIQYVGINFDWMPSDQFLGHNLSEDPVFIPSSTNHIFEAINIIVPPDATLGEHKYSVGIDGIEGTTEIFSWNSQNYIFVVQDPKKQAYDDLLTQVSNKITDSKSVNYQSSTAQSLVEQAEDAYAQALAYGNQNSWDDAVSMLNSASTYLEQADVDEQKYLEEKSSQENLLIIIGLVVVIIIAILAVFYLMRRKKDKILIPNPNGIQIIYHVSLQNSLNVLYLFELWTIPLFG